MPDRSTIEALDRVLRGQVITPDDAAYDEARTVWNGMVDARPALLVRCMGTEDAVGAVRFAEQHGLDVSVRGGGHSVAGASVCDGGLVVDLSAMNGVEVDPAARTAVVGPGARMADLDLATQAHGLATTGGVDSRTGIAGLTLGGGVGYLARKHGLTIDNLAAAQVVVGGGDVVRASETENADLLWGLRGGGGGLGVVTSFELRLHPLGPQVHTVQAFHRIEDGVEVLRFYRDLIGDAPDELACYALVVNVPPVDPFPTVLHGTKAVALVGVWAGDVDDGRAQLGSIERFGDPILAVGATMPYATLQSSFDAGSPDGGRYYWKSHYLSELSDEAIGVLVEQAVGQPGSYSMVGIEPLGGAVARVAPTATAFPHRNARFSLGIWSGWVEPRDDEEHIAATRRFHEAMAPHTTGGMYANYLDRDDAERVDAAYGHNWDRIRELRARYGV